MRWRQCCHAVVTLPISWSQTPRTASLRRSVSHRSPRTPRSSGLHSHHRTSMAKAVTLAPGDIEELPLEQLVDQVIEAWRGEAQKLEAHIDVLQGKVSE